MRICISKNIDLTNSLFSAVYFMTLDGWTKSNQNTLFFILDTLNNIDRLQQSGSCIWISDVGIWLGRIRARILPELHKCVCVCMDLCSSGRIRARILSTQIQSYIIRIEDPFRWSWFILFQVSINQKSSILITFCSCIK